MKDLRTKRDVKSTSQNCITSSESWCKQLRASFHGCTCVGGHATAVSSVPKLLLRCSFSSIVFCSVAKRFFLLVLCMGTNKWRAHFWNALVWRGVIVVCMVLYTFFLMYCRERELYFSFFPCWCCGLSPRKKLKADITMKSFGNVADFYGFREELLLPWITAAMLHGFCSFFFFAPHEVTAIARELIILQSVFYYFFSRHF